eukprot:m.51442 g.51442  ORF g.51442 m.51442 type:complete len:550 (+) comp10943_c0_seq1:83-1732(+)
MTTRAKKWLKHKLSGADVVLSTQPGTINAHFQTKLMKYTQKILAYCSNKKLHLKTSPPYLQGILFDVQEHIASIFSRNDLELLKQSPYLNLFGQKYFQQLKKTIKLFKDAKEEMENEHSEYRRTLIKDTLVFSHLFNELKTIYEGGSLNRKFEITKRNAREFWDENFGRSIVIPWHELITTLAQFHPLDLEREASLLKQTMDLTENNHITWFEFDIFTRLFQPWTTLINNWNVLTNLHPGYKAFLTYDEVEERLREFEDKPGSYVYRLSCTRLGQWAIGFVTKRHEVVQTIPKNKPLFQAIIEGEKDGVYLHPDGHDNTGVDLKSLISATPQERIKVTEEQYDIYYNMDTTFEVCKICDQRLKNIKIEPCGHLMCNTCLSKWEQQQHGHDATCPFCRKKVVSTEKVVIEPFKPSKPKMNQGMPTPPPPDIHFSVSKRAPTTINIPSSSTTSMDPQSHHEPTPQNDTHPSSDEDYEEAVLGDFETDGDDSDLSPPSSPLARTNFEKMFLPSQRKLEQLVGMGFDEDKARKALAVAKNDFDMATDILLQFG